MKPNNKWFVLALLTIVYIFNFIDRQVINILAEAIKNDLGFSDAQIGIMTGTAFAVFYSTMTIPISRIADKGNRKNVLSICLAIWSCMTALTGMVNSFWQMAIARMGVGIGEAGGVPTSYSILGDTFPAKERGRAMSIYSLGTSLGVFFAFAIGGYFLVEYGWRACLWIVGLPGILLSIIIYFTIKEPKRGATDKVDLAQREMPSLKEVFKIVFKKKTFSLITFAKGFHNFVGYAMSAFLPIFLIRVHEMPVKAMSLGLGLAIAIGGILGSFTAGFLSDYLGKRHVGWYSWVGSIGRILYLIPLYVVLTASDPWMAIYFTVGLTFCQALGTGPAVVVMQGIVDAKIRASTAALYLMISGLLGLGFGPLVIGIISDWLEPSYGVESIRYALMFLVVPSIIAFFLFLLAGHSYKKEIYVKM